MTLLSEDIKQRCEKLAANDPQSLRNIYLEFLDAGDIDLGRQKYKEVCELFTAYKESNLKFIDPNKLPNGLEDYVSLCENLISKHWYNINYVELNKLLGQKSLYKSLCSLCELKIDKDIKLFKQTVIIDWLPNGKSDFEGLLNGYN